MGRTSPTSGARIVALAASALVAAPLVASTASADEPQLSLETKTYIVQLDAAPIATYEGGVSGIAATAPAPGQKVNANSRNARAYEAHLRNEQRKALREAGVAEKAVDHEYSVAFSGFTAELNDAEAAVLLKSKGVANVWEDEMRFADTVTTPEYLGMSGSGGVWQTQFGASKGNSKHTNDGTANAGKGIVVGVLDTGIDPGNPSFAPLAGGAPRPSGFVCETENDPTFECTNKIVGARYYGTAYGNNVNYDFNSPRDTNGHGSHTAGTAAGNHGVPMTIQGYDLGEGSGMAPAAQVAVYKALWQTSDGNGSGTSSGLVAAIDDAVADGVDVINYSVSGSSTSVVGPDELAFLAAAEAGIFVATSAGNSGSSVGVSSVAHNAPWTMTVAASTHSRGAVKTITLGDGTVHQGVGVGEAVGPAPLISATKVGLQGVSAQAVRECWLDADDNAANGQQPTLDQALVAGKIVICDRGTVARVDKSEAVRLAGGVGMVQINLTDAESLNADFHTLPSIHLSATAGAPVRDYERTAANPTATISAVSDAPVDAPEMAGFSSYGPALAGEGDLLKPDITAPGVDVAAAYHQDLTTGEPTFNSISGTSMSAPHIAGLGALMKQKFPTWSPMAIKSAMMTTARQTTDAGKPIQWTEGDATPLNFGAGEVVPGKSYNPGLVYDSNVTDWYDYACSINQLQTVGGADYCESRPTKAASDLNYPSISIGKLAGSQTVTRTVTNVEKSAMQYRASVEAPAGTTVKVSPERITVPPGRSATFTVTITRTDAPLGEYTFGALTWVPNSGKHNAVRSPIAVNPVAIAAPGEITGSGVSGSQEISLRAGFTGTMNTDVDGLVPSTRVTVSGQSAGRAIDAFQIFTVPAGTKVTRFASFDEEFNIEDIDLYFFRLNADGTITRLAASGNDGSTEEITLRNLPAGMYVAGVNFWSVPRGQTASAPIHIWNVGDADAGNLTVEPSSVQVTQSQQVTLTANWSGLEPNRRYLGQVNYLEGSNVSGSTLVTVNP